MSVLLTGRTSTRCSPILRGWISPRKIPASWCAWEANRSTRLMRARWRIRWTADTIGSHSLSAGPPAAGGRRGGGGGGGGGGGRVISVGGRLGFHEHGRRRANLHGPRRDLEGCDRPARRPQPDRRPLQPRQVLRDGFRRASDVSEHRRRGDVHQRLRSHRPARRRRRRRRAAGAAAAAGEADWSPLGAGRETFGLSGGTLCHSSDGGRTFKKVPNHPAIGRLSFGKAAPGKDYPAIFVCSGGGGGAAAGIFRSDDEGATWVRINDAQHQWGNRLRASRAIRAFMDVSMSAPMAVEFSTATSPTEN